MSTADLVTLGKTLGLPGVFVLVWYLLEKARGERQATSEEQRAKDAVRLEEQRIAADNRRTDAMEEGFRSLASMIADHAQSDQESHQRQVERLAAIETTLTMRKTPPHGIPPLPPPIPIARRKP